MSAPLPRATFADLLYPTSNHRTTSQAYIGRNLQDRWPYAGLLGHDAVLDMGLVALVYVKDTHIRCCDLDPTHSRLKEDLPPLPTAP